MNLRPLLAQHLRQRLEAFREGFRHNLALIGPPGSGKTFQLQQLAAHQGPELLLIYCPLYRESCRGFLLRFLCAVLQAGLLAPEERAARQPHGRPAVPEPATGLAPQPFETLLRRAEERLPKTAAAIRPIEHLMARHLYSEAFNRALDTIPILMEERGQPCVLVLDEFLFLEELGLVHAFHELGKRVMTWPTTLFILASSSSYRSRRILRERLHLLFGQFELLTLDTLEPAPLTAWVHEHLRGVRGAQVMSPFLIRWVGAYPWYLAVCLKRLRELATLSKGPTGPETLFLQTAWDVLGAPEGTLHQWCASRLEGVSRGRLGTRGIEALTHIAEGARTTTELGKQIGRAGLSEALQLLVEHDLAQRNGMCWMVSDPVLRCWLSTVLSTQRADPRLSGTDARPRFDAYLRGLWTHWIQAHQLSFSEQVQGLFAKFSEDTVSLDSKIGRLPKFEIIRTQRPDTEGAEAYLIADGQGKRWCATVQGGPVGENTIAAFDAFCRAQSPKPSRKVVIVNANLDQHTRLLAKAANMWVWEPQDLHALMTLYGSL